MGIQERKQRQKAGLRAEILRAAREIVLREGFGGLTMRKIAEAIEYSPATIYLHFPGRDEIARELCLEGYGELLQALQPALAIADPEERLTFLARAYVEFGLSHAETYRLIFMEDPRYTSSVFQGNAGATGHDAGSQSFQLLVQTVDELKAGGRVDATINSLLFAELLWAAMHGIVSLGLTCPIFPTQSSGEMVDLLMLMVQGKLAAEK